MIHAKTLYEGRIYKNNSCHYQLQDRRKQPGPQDRLMTSTQLAHPNSNNIMIQLEIASTTQLKLDLACLQMRAQIEINDGWRENGEQDQELQ